MAEFSVETLKQSAKKLRKNTIDLAVPNYASHFGGFFSAVEIITSLYDHILKPEDNFVLSKGHACFPLYVKLREQGLNPKINAHPDIDSKNGICCTSGSLGHGLPIGIGMALARKLQNKPGRIYILMGDGETQEGTTWESMLIGGTKGRLNQLNVDKPVLDNLYLIVDCNEIQGSGRVDEIIPIKSCLEGLAQNSGWNFSEINGHSYPEIIPALEKKYKGPSIILANTIKGKGVSFMENKPSWHSKRLTPDQLNQAYEELK